MAQLLQGSVLQRFTAISGLVFVAAFALAVVLGVFERTICFGGLLRVKGGQWNGQPSPARMAALLSTMAFVVSFLPKVIEYPDEFKALDISQEWIFAIAGTHFTYLASKALVVLGRRV